jgi:TonB family protein
MIGAAPTVAVQGLMRFSALPSGHNLTYDLGGGSRTRSNHRRLTLARLLISRPSFSRLSLASLALLVFCLALASVPALRAQSEEHSSRKVIQSQKPDYPPVLKILGISGTVRLNAKVLANGTVARVSILGGNPVLAESAAKAVMTWKYAPAASSSNEIVTLDFKVH